MKIRKLIAVMIAAVMCFSLSSVAFAVNGEEEITQENVTTENPPAEESTSEDVSEEPAPEESTSEEAPSEENPSENPSEEESTEAPEEETTEAPDEEDVISLIISLLGKIDLNEVKDAFNAVNEALGLPKIENFTDIPAYADALYEKLEEMGLGYGDIINGLASSDLLDWLNKLIFSGGNSSAPSTTIPSGGSSDDFFEDDSDNDESPIPDTGVSFGVVAAAVAAMGGSGALAFMLRKRDSDEE